MEKNKIAIPEFLSGGGEMGEMIRSFDWTTTPLGEPQYWQQSLKTCVRILLTSPQPMFVWWGKNYINIYNDAYKFILGAKHPKALGRPGNETWKEIWNEVGTRADIVFSKNEGTFDDALLLIMNRHGYDEETYFKFSYNPVPGDNGGTAGLFCACTEETDRIISERRMNALHDLSKVLSEKKSVAEVFQASVDVLKKNGKSFPYALVYSWNMENQLGLCAYTSEKLLDFYPASINTDKPNDRYYDLLKVIATKKPIVVDDLRERLGDLPTGEWSIPPSNGLLLPIFQSNQDTPFAILKVGVNPYLQPDEKYMGFAQLIADQISTALSNVRALEDERKRIQALEEIDKAKTVFFSNISHEFRTPLTLMLGPLEELINSKGGNLSGRDKNSIETTHRNALRLLKLVNTLLDFSRIESGRQEANFTLTDISYLTKNLAANFRSVIEKAGLTLEVKAEEIIQPVYLDKQMWEKIVFNLLSNAFKYTLNGKITINIYAENDHAVFSVTDTGIGIPETELPKMFERFHRVNNSAGRSFEGTGIGLSLTKELVQLQGGNISVKSKEGTGSTFKVAIPFGKDHLDINRINNAKTETKEESFNIYIDESSNLLETDRRFDEPVENISSDTTILVVDDNADMREHLRSILERHYRVVTASNGLNALHRMRESKPDIIISDIMMPIMNGLQFLKEVKQDKQTARIPFILLTARAGEESKLEGYETGADDYLVKPFSGLELIARVKAQIEISKKWNETEQRLTGLLMQAPAAIAVMEGPRHVYTLVNAQFQRMFARTNEQLIGRSIKEVFPEISDTGVNELFDEIYRSGETYMAHEWPSHYFDENGKMREGFYNFVVHPMKDINGQVTDLMVHAVETTESVLARKKIEDNAAMIRNMYMNTPAFVAVFKGPDHVYELVNPYYQTVIGNRDVIGKKMLDALPELKGQGIDTLFDHVYSTGETVIDKERMLMLSRGENQEPEVAYFDYSFQPIYDETKNIIGILAFGIDITMQVTARKKIEESEEKLEQEVAARTIDLQRINKELESFNYIASHDLQEPLRKIQTFVELIRRDEDRAQHGSYLERIRSSAYRMSELIKSLLTYSNLSSSNTVFETIDLNETVKEVLSDLELLIEEKKATIKTGKLPLINAIPMQMYQLFLNIISNSLKFSTKEPNIKIKTQRIGASSANKILGINGSQEYMKITFVDNGIGIESKFNEQVFKLFQRLHLKNEYPGTGVGLSIVKRIVENHNGFIHLDSEPKKGTTINIYLPSLATNI